MLRNPSHSLLKTSSEALIPLQYQSIRKQKLTIRFSKSIFRGAFFALSATFFAANTSLAVLSSSRVANIPAPAGSQELLGRLAIDPSDRATAIPGWQVGRFERTHTAGLLVGSPIAVALQGSSDDDLTSAAKQSLQKAGREFDIVGCEFSVVGIHRATNLISVDLQAEIESVPVYGSCLTVIFNQSKELIGMQGRGFGSDVRGGFSLTNDAAGRIAVSAVGRTGLEVGSIRQVWLPMKGVVGIELRPAFEVLLISDDPQVRPAVFVDASSGEPVTIENRVTYENLPGRTFGMVHPKYGTDQEEEKVFPEEWVSLTNRGTTYSDRQGVFAFNVQPGAAPFDFNSELRGRWVDVGNDAGEDATLRLRLERIRQADVFWDSTNSEQVERMLFYHVNLIHAFWKGVEPGLNGMDYSLIAVGNIRGLDNAYWNGQGIYFGAGGQLGNFGLYADVIHHEFGHAITSTIYRWDQLPYTGESGALNEGWSDYFPCSLSDEPLMGEGGLVAGGYIRNIDNNLVYPRDISGEVHADSRIISAAMWHTRAQLGVHLSDSLFHYSRYLHGADFLTWFTNVLMADDDDGDITNGTPHSLTLYDQFGKHGVGPGIAPTISISSKSLRDDDQRGASGNDDRIFEQGETARLELTLERLGTLYPPPARNVRIDVTTDAAAIDLENTHLNVGEMRVGDQAALRQPVLIHVRQDAQLQFVHIYLSVSADDFGVIYQDTLRIPIGRPTVLLVNGGGNGIDRTPWFESSLDRLGVTYAEIASADPAIQLGDRLSHFRSVIWFTGDTRDDALLPGERQEIANYLNDGGNVFLTGQYAAQGDDRSAFFRQNFGTTVVRDTVQPGALDGLANDPVAKGMRLLILGAGGAMNQLHPAGIQSVNGGIEIFHWQRVAGHPAGGIRFEHQGGGKTVFLSFGMEAIGGHGATNRRWDLMSGVLTWFGEELSAQKPAGDQTPVSFKLTGTYPNPFNSTCEVGFTLAHSAEVNLAVFDLSGRKVVDLMAGEVASGQHRVIWNASELAGGIYLLRAESDGEVNSRKLLLVK